MVSSDLVEESVARDNCSRGAVFAVAAGVALGDALGSEDSDGGGHVVAPEYGFDIVLGGVGLLLSHGEYGVGFPGEGESGSVPEAECALQESVAQGVDGSVVDGGPENDGVSVEHLVPDPCPVILDFAYVVGGASEASLAALDGLASEVDVFVGFPGLHEDVLEEVLGDPFHKDSLVVADGAPAAGVDAQNHVKRSVYQTMGV